MHHVLFVLLLTLLTSCSLFSKPKRSLASELEITEIEANEWTALTKKNLLQLTVDYDLSPFLYTKKIHIQSRVIPH